MRRLKELRKQNGISQQKLANDLDVSRSTVAMWETQGTETDNPTLIKTAEYFGVTVDYLLGVDSDKPLYKDHDADEYANRLFKDPNLRMLLDATEKLDKEDIDLLVQFAKKMKGTKEE